MSNMVKFGNVSTAFPVSSIGRQRLAGHLLLWCPGLLVLPLLTGSLLLPRAGTGASCIRFVHALIALGCLLLLAVAALFAIAMTIAI